MAELLQPFPESLRRPEVNQSIDPRYAPQFISWKRVQQGIGDRYEYVDHSEEDRKVAAMLEQCRDAILSTLADRFHIAPDRISRMSIPDSEVGSRQRSHFAWVAIYNPSEQRIYYCDGRMGHEKILMQYLLPHSKIDPTAAEQVTMEHITRGEKAEQGKDPLEGWSFDSSRPYLVDGFFSAKPLNETFPDLPKELHTITRVPLPGGQPQPSEKHFSSPEQTGRPQVF